VTARQRLRRDDAESTYIRAGELEVFRQLQRDGAALDVTLADERAPAVGPFSRLRTDAVADELGKTRGAFNHVWGSQEAFRAAVMADFLNDTGLGLDEAAHPDPASCHDLDEWITRWAASELERGPRHGMPPENRYGLRWAAWLGLVPYGLWSDAVAEPSLEEYRASVRHLTDDVLAPAFEHFAMALRDDTTLDDVGVAAATAIEGTWLNACLTSSDPIGRDGPLTNSLAATLRAIIRGSITMGI
jgi:AcrR family transcriptional regulator